MYEQVLGPALEVLQPSLFRDVQAWGVAGVVLYLSYGVLKVAWGSGQQP